MKKIFLFAVAFIILTGTGPLRAQSPYHHIGDAINNPDSIYWLGDWAVDNWLANPNHQLDFVSYSCGGLIANPSRLLSLICNGPGATYTHPELNLVGELLRCCYTSDTIKVIGLAAIAYTLHWDNWRPDVYYLNDTLLLYSGRKKNPEVLRKVKWSMQDSSRWIRPYSRGSIIYPTGDPNFIAAGGCCTTDFYGSRVTVPLKEYYFEDYGEEPVLITDSFFVGCTHSTYQNIFFPMGQDEPDDSVHWDQTGYAFYGYDSAAVDSCPTCESFPEYEYIIKRTGRHPSFYPLNEWITEKWRWYLAIWPIIDISYGMPPPPPYACPMVQNIRTTYYDECAVIQWDANSEHNDWQISYGPAGIEPDSGTIVNCPIQVNQICIDTGVHYSAFVRAKCIKEESVYYSEWSDSIDLFVAGTTQEPDDINSVTSRFVTLMPNPAYDVVQVVSSYGINRVEVYDLQGTLMTETEAKGISTSFGTKEWPDGIYFVIIHTPAGSFSKRLVVKN